MKKIPFYLLTNKLYTMNLKSYFNYLKSILSSEWFKKACKEKKLKIVYLSKKHYFSDRNNCYLKYEDGNIYFFKLFLLRFEYQEPLENNNHLKLLNINIKHQTIYNVAIILNSLQKLFLDTGYYPNMNFIDRKVFIKNYVNKYNSYLDLSVLSKILNNTDYMHNNCLYKLNNLFPKKTFIYSLYIKTLINSEYTINNDSQLAKLLFEIYNIKISRRAICDIRNKYLIPTVSKNKSINFSLHFNTFNNSRKILNKENITSIRNNLKGVYELSSNEKNFYPFFENKVIYIGSSCNLRKRLLVYTTKNVHTKDIKDFIQNNEKIYFRIIKTIDYQKQEKELMNTFINIYGDLPKLNSQRILK